MSVMDQSIIALVPLAAPQRSKSRLAGALTPSQREHLARHLADHVVRTLCDVRQVNEVAVIGPPEAYQPAWARLGVAHVVVPGRDLNADLSLGRAWAMGRDADAILVVHGDLAWLDPESVRQLVLRVGARGNHVVIAGNSAKTGTNALAIRPPDALPFAFGQDSYATHLRLAAERELSIESLSMPALAKDIDVPDDVTDLEADGRWNRWQAAHEVKEPA